MLNISRRATIVSQCRLYAMRFSFKPQTRQKGSHSITLITLKRKLTTAPKEASRTVRGRLPSGPLSLRLREGRPLVMSGGALAMLSTLMTADLSMMIPNGEQYFGGESERESLNLREDEAHRGALEEDCFDEEGDEAEPTARVVAEWQGSWVLVRDSKLLAVMEQARMGLASVGNRAARAMAHVRRVIDDEMDRLRSLRLSRADVDAKRRSLHFLNPARETTLEVAARLVRWLRREAEALASGFSDGDTDASSQTDELSDGEQEMEERRSRGSRRIRRREDEGMSARRHWTFSLTSLPESTYGAVHEDSSPPIKARRLPSYYARTEWGESADETFGFVRRCGSSDALVSALARRALSETPARVLQRVYIHVGNVVDLGRASIVCRSWRERTRRDTSGRLVWKWTCRFGYLPPTGSMCCAGLWLSLADNVRAARYKLSAPLDDFGEVLTVRSVSWPGRDDSVSRWRAQIAVDVARAPLARLWRGLRVPGEYVTFDQAQADTIKPYRDLVARVCAHVAVAHPRLGYCQGVDYVVAYALRATCLNAVAAAKLVSTLFDDLDLAGLFEPGLPGLKKRCLELGLLLDARCPNFARHLKEHGVQMELFAAAWVQTLFVYVDALPLRCLDRAWTLLLFERSWKPMHRLSLAIFATLESHIIYRCAAPHDILIFVSQLTNPDRPSRQLKSSSNCKTAPDEDPGPRQRRRFPSHEALSIPQLDNDKADVSAHDLLGDSMPDDGQALVCPSQQPLGSRNTSFALSLAASSGYEYQSNKFHAGSHWGKRTFAETAPRSLRRRFPPSSASHLLGMKTVRTTHH